MREVRAADAARVARVDPTVRAARTRAATAPPIRIKEPQVDRRAALVRAALATNPTRAIRAGRAAAWVGHLADLAAQAVWADRRVVRVEHRARAASPETPA